MERVGKTFFNPLVTSKAQIRDILKDLPVGSAHPFSPERILLCRTPDGTEEIDLSSYSEDYFFNAVDLGEMGETLLRRMSGFQSHLGVFREFQIMQAPDSTFKIPIVSGQITILTVSERTPTYYDFCFADADCNTCCWKERNTFSGIRHSGDIKNGKDLLHYVQIDSHCLIDKEICVFISGFDNTRITRFLGTNPAVLVADHVEKMLYIVPVPLDAATIGDATICCPLVIKRDEDSLICSILPTATTDRNIFCNSHKLQSSSFPEAIRRAEFTLYPPGLTTPQNGRIRSEEPVSSFGLAGSEHLSEILESKAAIIATSATAIPPFIAMKNKQIIRFGTGLDFKLPDQTEALEPKPSTVELPCIFGTQLQGPILLATGTIPCNMPFADETSLRQYYNELESIIVVVDDRMTDNARNLAGPYRMNVPFIVQVTLDSEPKHSDELLSILNAININAVTALAGPQSLVLVQIFAKLYFYRGLANPTHLNTSKLIFGSDVTSIVESVGLEALIDSRVKRMVNLAEEGNAIFLPWLGQSVKPRDLQQLFERLSLNTIKAMNDDISAALPQLQALLNEKELKELSTSLVSSLSAKISAVVTPEREKYIKFLTNEYRTDDLESTKVKNTLLGQLRKVTKEAQEALEPVISSFSNMISSQTTSKRTHDIKRLARQTQIQNNVEAVKSMTYETLAAYLESHAADMGVMLLNINTPQYARLLANLKTPTIDAGPCCDLDSRVLHLEGFDAGIVIEQSQTGHRGPLRGQAGPSHPILAVPYLGQGRGVGSMLAWVCWDEFVNLENPYSVRWLERCNESHIAALRIMVRDTLSNAVVSREFNFQPGSPEIGQLMGALLMAAMSKLAGMRTTAPLVVGEAEDTSMKLMRGLFGNLLTMAASGVRPMSMVWQLLGSNPRLELPTTDSEWSWYEAAVTLYPFTGWPREKFRDNLERLIDKAILRVLSRAEAAKDEKSGSVGEMIRTCKLQKIELGHCRTIITVLMRMLTAKDDDVDVASAAERLLAQLPSKLEKNTKTYAKMISYLRKLAGGGNRERHNDLAAANAYNKRSGVFKESKTHVAAACRAKDWPKMKEACQALMEKHAEVAALWQVPVNNLLVRNITPYRDLLHADFGENIDQFMKNKNKELIDTVLSDAEIRYAPWQVGKEDEFPPEIESLDEGFVNAVINGKTNAEGEEDESDERFSLVESKATHTQGILQFKSSLQASFVDSMQKHLSAEEVCRILNIPVSAMQIFLETLNPEFVWSDLGDYFKGTILMLLKNRSGRDQSQPVKSLLKLKSQERESWRLKVLILNIFESNRKFR